MRPNVRAILFDFGDTLVQFGDVDRSALFKRAAWETYQLWAQRNDRMPDFQRYYLHQWFALRWGYFKLLLMRREMDAMRYIRRACRKLWLTAEDDFFAELAWDWYRPLTEIATLEPDTHRMLTELAARGYRLGIVSNTFVPGFVLDRHLAQLDLLRYFPHRVYSCDVAYRKPDRRIFEAALDRIGCRAEETAFVGDSLNADIDGAQRVGMLPVWKRASVSQANRRRRVGVATIDRLAALPRLLAQFDASREAAALTA
jgi:putative hydrolase of the HAD superfamily